MPFMGDADYNSIICTAQKTNPATPANKNVVTMAVIVEKAGGILGNRAYGNRNWHARAGFSPTQMEYYDFGPLGSKTGAMRRNPLTLTVKGDRWWDNNPGVQRGDGTSHGSED